MKKLLFALTVAVSAVALGEPPTYGDTPNKTEQLPPRDQSLAPLPDELPATTKAPKLEPRSGQLSAQDLETLAKLHDANMAETQMGMLAKKLGGSKRVKAFGDVLVKDHTLAEKQVQAYVKKKGIDLKARSPKDEAEQAEAQAHADTMARMETMKGDAFDDEFVQMMAEGHQKAVEMVERTLASTQDAQLHSLLNKLLPVLKEHRRLAEGLAKTPKSV